MKAKMLHELRTHAAIEDHVFYPKVEAKLGKKIKSVFKEIKAAF